MLRDMLILAETRAFMPPVSPPVSRLSLPCLQPVSTPVSNPFRGSLTGHMISACAAFTPLSSQQDGKREKRVFSRFPAAFRYIPVTDLPCSPTFENLG